MVNGRASPDAARQLERRRTIPFGDKWVVESAFGCDGFRAVIRARVATLGHHRAAITGRLGDRAWLGQSEFSSRPAEARKEFGASGSGDVRVLGRRRPYDVAVGQLLIKPTTKGFQQVMRSTG